MIRELPKNSIKEFMRIAKDYLGVGKIPKDIKEFPSLCLGEYVQGKLVGIIYGRLNGKTAIIEGLAVEKDFWGKGIGRKLVLAFEEKAKGLGAEESSVGAATMPKDVTGFYERLGYKRIEDRNKYTIMSKNLKN